MPVAELFLTSPVTDLTIAMQITCRSRTPELYHYRNDYHQHPV